MLAAVDCFIEKVRRFIMGSDEYVYIREPIQGEHRLFRNTFPAEPCKMLRASSMEIVSAATKKIPQIVATQPYML